MATLSLIATGHHMDINGPVKPTLDGGGHGQGQGQDQDNLLTFLMEKLKMTSKQVKAWSEERLKLRDAMAVYKNTDNVDPDRLQKCLENIKKAITVSSLPAMVERLEALAKPANLKVMSTPEGNIFISSDTFYVEVRMGENGNVQDVMVAHCKDPESCINMSESLKQSNFKEFAEHLCGLADFYQTGGDANQKAKAFSSLQCLEKDLITILTITKKSGHTALTLVKNNLGYCTLRAGGRHMRLTFFISPYDLLDMEHKQPKEFGPEDPLPKDIGLWVSIGLENSQPRKLQTMPLIVPNTSEGKVAHVGSQLGPTNSINLPAVFTLSLSQPMPISVVLFRQLQNHVGVTLVYSESQTALPINTLICRHTLDPDFFSNQQSRNGTHPRGYTFHVNLPDQKQRYFVSDSPMVGEIRGLLIRKILFVQHTQVLQTIRCLRQQATYNALVASCVRKTDQENDESEEVFEVTAYNLHRMTVLFEHPAKDGMACVEFDTSDGSNPKCKLFPREGEEPFCSEEYATKVLQKCLSIPITMRAILKKTADWLETRKQKEVPAAATPVMGSSPFSSPTLPSSGPYSAIQKLNKSFGATPGASYNSAKIKERSISGTQNYQGSILNDLTSSMATFFPQPQPTYTSNTTAITSVAVPGEALLSPVKQTQNPMLASLLQNTITGGGPPALRIPVQQQQLQPVDPLRLHQSPPPTCGTAAQQPKHSKNPMLLNLLQEPNIDASFASSLQVNKARKQRRKKTVDKSPQLYPEDEPSTSGHEIAVSQDVFKFSVAPKLSSMPLLKDSPKQQPSRQSPPVSSDSLKSQFDMSKQNQILTEFSPLINKVVLVDQSKVVTKKPSRSDSVTSLSSIGVVPPSPRQSPKTPMSPATTCRPSCSSTPELTAPSPSIVLPGMITEMLPKSDPLQGIGQSNVLSPDFGGPPKVLTTPSHQVHSDPFDFTEDIKDIIEINVPNFEDMFINPKTDSDEFGLSSVNSAIAKLESVSVLDNEEEKKCSVIDVIPLLSEQDTVNPKSPHIGSRSQSIDLHLPGLVSIRPSGDVALDLSKTEVPKPTSSSPIGKELRSSISSPTLPVQSPLQSPPKSVSKSHTSKGKPKDFSKSFQTDIPKLKTKRAKKNLKEPTGPADAIISKKGRKRGRRKKYPDSSPECATGEDYETTVPYGQPLKMTIKLKPVESKPRFKGLPQLTTKIKVKTLPALGASSSQCGQRQDVPETITRVQSMIQQVQPIQYRREPDDFKKDRFEMKPVEKQQSRKEILDGNKTESTERVMFRKLSEPQKVRFDERSSFKVQNVISKQVMKVGGSAVKITKARTDVIKRPPYMVKGDLQKPSPEDILSSVLPRQSVSSYKIPKLKKILSQDISPKVALEGDNASILQSDITKKVSQSSVPSKCTDQTRLSSPKRTPNSAMQRPRSASPSIRHDPNKRFDVGKLSPFTKPIPGQKGGGSVSPRGSVSPQSNFGSKIRISGEKSDRRGESPSPLDTSSSPSNRMSPSLQLRVSASSGMSTSTQSVTKSSQDNTSSVHSSRSLSTSSPKTISGGNFTINTKVRSTTGLGTKTGLCGSQQAKTPSSAPTPNKSQSIPSSPKTGFTQVKLSQPLKSSPVGSTQQVKQVTRPVPLVIPPNTRPLSSDLKNFSPGTPQTPLSATGPRLKSPTTKPRKTTSLNAIVSKLTERVQEKTTGEGTHTEKDEDQKKQDLLQGDNEQVVKALLSSGLVEKASVASVKVSSQKLQQTPPSKQSSKEESAKAALIAKQGGVSLASKSISTLQTKTAVAEALKSIAQLSKPGTTPTSKQNPLPTQVKGSLQTKNMKVTTLSYKSAPAKNTGNNSSVQAKSTAVTSAQKTTSQVKVTGASKAGVGATKPKLIITTSGKSNQPDQGPSKIPSKVLYSPSSHRPIILSKSSSTVTSPDKGATKVTRVQIAPVSTTGGSSSSPVGTKVTLKAQSPSLASKPKQDRKEQDSRKNHPGGDYSEKGKSFGEEYSKMETEQLRNRETGDSLKGKQDKFSADQQKDGGKSKLSKSETKFTHLESKNSSITFKPTLVAEDAERKTDSVNNTPAKSSLKRSASKDGCDDISKKVLKVSCSPVTGDNMQAAIPLSPKSLNAINKSSVQKSGASASKASGIVAAKSSYPSYPKDIEFKVPSPAMLPPSSPRNMIYAVRSPGPAFKPSSPTQATSPVSPGIPSPTSGEPAIGGVPSPQGVKRAATPEEAALPSKRSMLLESCSPVSPAESDDGLVIDVPTSPSQRRQKAGRGKEIGEASNRGHMQVKSPLPQSPLLKSPQLPVKSPTGISVGSGDAGSPCTLDDDLMDEALSSIREDAS